MGLARGWPVYLAWVVVGAGSAAAVAAAASIGLFLVPVVAVGAGFLLRARTWPEALGAVTGVGLLLVVAGLTNLDYVECGAHRPPPPPGATEVSCGGVPPEPLLIAGAVLAIGGAVGYRRLS